MTRLEKTIINEIEKANKTWQLFAEKDRLLLAVSGGKDSLALYHLLQYFPVEIEAVHIRLSRSFDSGFIARNNLTGKIKVIETDIYDRIKTSENSPNTCYACSKQRRKKILEYARDREINKIVFGHHRNDVVETLLLNLIFSREVSTLLPRQPLFSGSYEIIRPFYSLDEKLLVSLQKEQGWCIQHDQCEEANNSKRQFIRDILKQVQSLHPKIDVNDNIYSALQHIRTDFLPFPAFS